MQGSGAWVFKGLRRLSPSYDKEMMGTGVEGPMGQAFRVLVRFNSPSPKQLHTKV